MPFDVGHCFSLWKALFSDLQKFRNEFTFLFQSASKQCLLLWELILCIFWWQLSLPESLWIHWAPVVLVHCAGIYVIVDINSESCDTGGGFQAACHSRANSREGGAAPCTISYKPEVRTCDLTQNLFSFAGLFWKGITTLTCILLSGSAFFYHLLNYVKPLPWKYKIHGHGVI